MTAFHTPTHPRASFRPQSLMSAEVEEFSRTRLRRLLVDKGIKKVKVLPFCPLSSFFNFDDLQSSGFGEAEKRAIRYAELAFACVVTDIGAQELVLVVIREDTPHSLAAQQVVRSRLGSRPVVWKENDSLLKLLDAIREHVAEGLVPARLSPQCPTITSGEKETAKLIQQALFLYSTWLPSATREDPDIAEMLAEEVAEAREKYWFWHEVPLKRFIRCADTDLQGSEAKLRDFWFITSADLLVTTRGPDYLPLLCVEYDSEYHDSAEQQITDRKRDEIFRRAGIPLLRVRRNDVFTPNEIRKGRVRDAIGCLVEQQVVQRRYECSSIAKNIKALHELARSRKVAKDMRQPSARFKQKYLTETEAERLDELLLEEWCETQIDEQNLADGFAMAAHAECGLLRLKSVEDTETGTWAILNRVDKQDSVVGQIRGPRILLKGAVTESFSKAQRLLAIQFAFEDALSCARM